MTTRDLHAALEQMILPVHTPQEVVELVIANQTIEHTTAIIDPCSGTAAFAVVAAGQCNRQSDRRTRNAAF